MAKKGFEKHTWYIKDNYKKTVLDKPEIHNLYTDFILIWMV